MVVVIDDLDLDLELVDLSLHELLSDLSEEFEVEFYEATLHDLLSKLNSLLLTFLNDLPELVRESISALVELFLRLIVFAEIRILVRETVEILDELIKNGLLAIACVEELEEFILELGLLLTSLLPLKANVAEDAAHLMLVVSGEVTPHLNNDRFEVVIQIVTIRQGWHRLHAHVLAETRLSG